MLYHFFGRSEACSTSSWSMVGEAGVAFQIPGSAWLAPVAPWQMWHEEHLVAPATYLSPSAAPGWWQQACHWEQLPAGEGKLGWRHDPVTCKWRQLQDLSDAAAVWISDDWEEEGGGRTVFSLPGHRHVTGGSWREDNERAEFLPKITLLQFKAIAPCPISTCASKRTSSLAGPL